MYKKIASILLALSFMFVISACGKTKTLHCDSCGEKVTVSEKSNMEEDWIILCEECDDIDLEPEE